MSRLLAAAGLIGLMLVPLAAATDSAFPGKAGKLVFQSNRSGDYELYTANANGSGVRKLLSRPQTDEFNAAWSPGGLVVFQTGPKDGTNFDIWIVNADGKGAGPLVTGPTNDRAPQFCDEQTIVFTRQLTETNSEVYAFDLQTQRLRRLTTHPAIDSFPTCNPKGTRIAFISAREGPPRIYEMTRTGGGPRAIADPGSVDPDYSPDGKEIAYVAYDADGYFDVFTRNLASGRVTRRSDGKAPFDFRLPKFSPAYRAQTAGALQEDNTVMIATYRTRDSLEELVVELDREDERETSRLVSGSGGSLRFQDFCTCRSLKAKLTTTAVFTGLKEKDKMDLDVFLEARLRCTNGVGHCHAAARLVAQSEGLAVAPSGKDAPNVTITCKGPCGRSTRERLRTTLTGDGRYGYGRRGTGIGALYAVIRWETFCDGKTKTGKFIVAFLPDTGRVNYDRSDLNGDGKADGA